jgi:hypothetical protein
MCYRIAGIDVHKKMLAVVVADVEVEGEYEFERRKFRSNPAHVRLLVEWPLERIGHNRAIWAIAHQLCRLIWILLHQQVRYEERGPAVAAISKQKHTDRMGPATAQARVTGVETRSIEPVQLVNPVS